MGRSSHRQPTWAHPGAGDVRAALRRIHGEAAGEERFRSLCASVGTSPNAVELTPEALARIALLMLEVGGAEAVIGRSLDVRLRTIERLRRADCPDAGDSGEWGSTG